ncbi:MAG: hypothetical protein HUU27_12995, partial [Phycisphaerae bacterium]|nr:hypothetical protein [Phycisphaerae bacterium]
ALLMLVAAWPVSAAAQNGAIMDWLAAAARERAGPRQTEGDALPWQSGEPVRRQDDGLLDVNVRRTDIAAVLESLSYQARANIVASPSVRGEVSANLYGVTLWQALDAVLTPGGFVYRRNGNLIYIGTPAEIASQLPPPVLRVFKLRYITRGEAVTAIGTLLGDVGKVTAGGPGTTAGVSGTTPSGTGSAEAEEGIGVDYVLVTAPPELMPSVEQLLREIDVRPKQVLIEATILRATLNESMEMGIDFTLLGGVDFQNVSSTSDAAANIRTGALPEEFFQDTTVNANTDFAANVSAGGFTFGIIHNQFGAFIRALEDVTDVVVVANPKVIALNKREAEVIVGRRDGYLTTTVTQTAAVQTVDFLETGTQIKIRPVINDDGTVRMRVHPKDSSGGLTAAQLPFEETTEATAEILVEDGKTVLIGGLFRERTSIARSQIPLLGNIPGLGVLFQSSADRTIREEVIVLLTVHVLKHTREEDEAFASLVEDVERVRVGSRRGLSGLARERLAQAFYQEAVRQAEAGQRDLAMLNVRMALHNAPKHLAALKLKESLLSRRLWDSEGTRMRTIALQLIQNTAAEPGRGPLFERPQMDFDPGAARPRAANDADAESPHP